MSEILKNNTIRIIKASALYCSISALFSLIGIFLAEKGPLANPIGGLSIQEVGGHFIWGFIFGAVTLSFRYAILAGLFAVLIDSDHLVGLTNIYALGKMSHSIAFGMMVFFILILFYKKDFRLGALGFAAVLSHISFDIFAGDTKFPIFSPFYNNLISFSTADWLFFEIAAIVIMGSTILLTKDRFIA